MWPFTKIKKLENEVTRLTELLAKSETGKIGIRDLKSEEGGMALTLTGSPLHLFADAFYEQFEASKAVNFLTMDFFHKDTSEKFEITMQKVSGESTCDQLKRLRSENESLRKLKED